MQNILIPLVSIFLLASCNTTKIFYNYGDFLISWQVDNYFDLTDTQTEWIEKKSKSHLDWHRKTELPIYKEFLTKIKENALDGLSMSELENAFSMYEKSRDKIFERLTPDIAVFLASLSNEQIDFLEKKMIEENEEMKTIVEDNKKKLEKRKEYFFEQMENWFGELSEIQVDQLNELQNKWFLDSSQNSKKRLKLRIKSQNQFVSILRTNPDELKIENWLRQWTFDMVNSSNKKRKERILVNKKRILEVDKILTYDQRLKAIQELDYWIKIIEEIIEASKIL